MSGLFVFFRRIQWPANEFAALWLRFFISLCYPCLVRQCTSCYRELWRPQEDSPFLCHFKWRCYLCRVVARSPSQTGPGPSAVHPGRSACRKVSAAKPHLSVKLRSELAVQRDCSGFQHRNLPHPSHQTPTESVFQLLSNFPYLFRQSQEVSAQLSQQKQSKMAYLKVTDCSFIQSLNQIAH